MKELLVAVALVIAAAEAAADDSSRLQALEQRVDYLEDELARTRGEWRAAEPADEAGSWADRISLSGSVELGHYGGQDDSVLHDAGYRVWDTRFFLDAELGEDIRVGELPLVRNIGLTAEWNLVRLGEVVNDVGDLYVDLQGIGGTPWLNLRPGRFQVPVGEAYHLYGREAARSPFISNPLGGPWWWDEGVALYGGPREGRFGYIASVSNGETPFGFDDGSGEQVTLKLWAQPLPWLYLSASGLHSGEIGNGTGALWLGETWATPIGGDTDVPTFFSGAAQADATGGYDRTWLAGADVVITPLEAVRLWLAYGQYQLDAQDGSDYDRTLHYAIAELVLHGGLHRAALRAGLRRRARRHARHLRRRARLSARLAVRRNARVQHGVVLGVHRGRGLAARALHDPARRVLAARHRPGGRRACQRCATTPSIRTPSRWSSGSRSDAPPHPARRARDALCGRRTRRGARERTGAA